MAVFIFYPLHKCSLKIILRHRSALSINIEAQYQEHYRTPDLVVFSPKIAIWLRNTNNPNPPKHIGSTYICELSLHAKFQLPRLCKQKKGSKGIK